MFKRTLAAFVTTALVATSLVATAPAARADITIEGDSAVLLIFTGLLVTTTVRNNQRRYDVSKAQSLVDQAYAGQGEKLELLSSASKKSVEEVAEIIVGLDKAGKIDAKNPEAMAQSVAAALK